MERSRRRDLRMKIPKIMINIKPTMATGTAHTTGLRPFFLSPVCFPAVGLTLPSLASKEVMQKMEFKSILMLVSLTDTLDKT